MSSNFPTYDSNTFPIDSFNQYTLSAFNPYGLYHYTVTIVSPVFPDGQTELIATPEVTVEDFMFWAGNFRDIKEIGTDHFMFQLLNEMIKIAKIYIDVNLLGSDNNYNLYKRTVSMYVAHYLEMHYQLLKDEANQDTFSKGTAVKEKEITVESPQGYKSDFMRTTWGVLFWTLYGQIARFGFQSEYSTWGAI
jgi:hypothetical protein